MYNMNSLKAQSSIEFMIIFITLLIIMSIAVWISISKTTEVNNIERGLETDIVLNNIANKVNMVHVEGDGFSTNLTLPTTIQNMDYTVTIINNQILLDIEGITYSRMLLTDNISGIILPGYNILKNVNGEVVVS